MRPPSISTLTMPKESDFRQVLHSKFFEIAPFNCVVMPFLSSENWCPAKNGRITNVFFLNAGFSGNAGFQTCQPKMPL